jgi:hypothetical protein
MLARSPRVRTRALFSTARVAVIAHGAAFAAYNGAYALRNERTASLVISVLAKERATVADARWGTSSCTGALRSAYAS